MVRNNCRKAKVERGRRKTSARGLIVCEKSFLWAILILGFLGSSQWAHAQEYPTRPITLLISTRPGGGVDIVARVIAKEAQKILGQEFIPVNKSGGASATGVLASSKADGYTILAGSSGALTNIPHIESVPYNPIQDIIPIIQIGTLTSGFIVRSENPVNSLRDLIDFARKNPGKVNCGVPGIGFAPHLVMVHVAMQEKVDIAMIPQEGAAASMPALLGGHITVNGTSTSAFVEQLKAGKVKLLALTSDKRMEFAPEAPTVLELGYPDGNLSEMYIIQAPKGTPPAVVKRLEEAFYKGMQTPTFRALTQKTYVYTENPLFGQKFKEFIEAEYVRNGKIVQRAKLGK
jgi:tripartite-type tricarboxylate transporter receptor subunit TctC